MKKNKDVLFLPQTHLLNFFVVASVVIVRVVVGNFVVAAVLLLNISIDLQKPHDFEQKACMNAFEIVQ